MGDSDLTRRPSTTTAGGSFSEATINAVWAKARIVQGYDPTKYRLDRCGHWIARDEYGKTTQWGWEIDHIKPVAKGGMDDLSNLQPLYWYTNRSKGDTYPWSCAA